MYYENYERIRDSKGMTDAQVANASGVAPATLSEWKKTLYSDNPNDKGYTPKIDKLLAISKALESDLTDIIGS